MMVDITLQKGESPTCTVVTINGLRLVFSYETVVAFRSSYDGWVVCENVWSKTTGKHLNEQTPKGIKRTPYMDFQQMLKTALETVTA